MDSDRQEDRNDVIRRLGGRNNEEDWSQTVYPLPGTPGEDEYNAPRSQPENEINPGELFSWFIRFATIGYLAGIAARLLSDDEIRLHLMHFSIRMLQATARIVGWWALKTEKQYNEYVNTLH